MSMLVTSPGLSIRHGFSTRQGGVSEGPFASLNLARNVGDALPNVEENERRLAAALELSSAQLVSANQVHGAVILEVKRPLPSALGDADGLLTGTKGVALCIRTADCVPILLHAPDVEAIAAVHAGWKGTHLSIAGLAVARLAKDHGAAPGKIRAAIGPSIRRCCYEVGGDLAEKFRAAFGDGVLEERPGQKPHLDLAAANRLVLERAGILPENISVLPHCTACDAARFFSHRRDQGVTGRHVSLLVL